MPAPFLLTKVIYRNNESTMYRLALWKTMSLPTRFATAKAELENARKAVSGLARWYGGSPTRAQDWLRNLEPDAVGEILEFALENATRFTYEGREDIVADFNTSAAIRLRLCYDVVFPLVELPNDR